MEKTPNIYIVGGGLRDLADALAKDFAVRALSKNTKSLAHLGKADLVVISGSFAGRAAEIAKATRNVPKVIVPSGGGSRSLSRWLKEPYSYPLPELPAGDAVQFIHRILTTEIPARRDLMRENLLMRKEIALFEELNRKLTETSEMSDVLGLIVQSVKGLIGASSCSIFLIENGVAAPVMEKIEDRPSKAGKKTRHSTGAGIAGWVASRSTSIISADASSDKRYVKKVDATRGLIPKALISVPMINKGKPIGVLQVFNKDKAPGFSKKDLRYLERLADQAALSMERIKLYQKMEELAVTDDLTNLFNIRYLNRSIETEIARSKRYSTSVSLIFLDLDHFKNINDNFGHLIGSKLLVELSQIILAQLRSIDIVIRYGGDEFVIILPQTILNHGMMVAERIRKALERHVFLTSEGMEIKMTSSFGVAAYPETAKSKEELIRLADEAMYRVKYRTRNAVYAII